MLIRTSIYERNVTKLLFFTKVNNNLLQRNQPSEARASLSTPLSTNKNTPSPLKIKQQQTTSHKQSVNRHAKDVIRVRRLF